VQTDTSPGVASPPEVALVLRARAPAPAPPSAAIDELGKRFVQWVTVQRATVETDLDTQAQRFIASCGIRKSVNTTSAYTTALGYFCAFAAERGIRTPADVDHQTVDDYLGWLKSKGQSNKSINLRLAALRSFFKFMRRDGVTINNPAADCERLKDEKRMPRYLSIPEQEKFLEALAKGVGLIARRDEAMIAVGLLAGLRCSEIMGLRVDEVDLASGVIRVVQGKGKKDREVPAIPRLAIILRAYLTDVRPQLLRGSESAWLFVNVHIGRQSKKWFGGGPRPAGTKLHRIGFYQRLRKLSEDILGRRVNPHALRHSFASRLRRRGADLQVISEALGHASITTTAIYAHISAEDRHAMLSKMLSE
jgi:integrase/recombinase XerD